MSRAIKKLRVLGSGFAVIPVGGRRLVQSVPGELSMDHTAVLQKAEVCKYWLLVVYLCLLKQPTLFWLISTRHMSVNQP